MDLNDNKKEEIAYYMDLEKIRKDVEKDIEAQWMIRHNKECLDVVVENLKESLEFYKKFYTSISIDENKKLDTESMLKIIHDEVVKSLNIFKDLIGDVGLEYIQVATNLVFYIESILDFENK